MPPSSQQAYQSLQDYSKKRRTTQDIQKEAETKYDISGISSRLSGLRSLVGNLQSSVEQVDPSVTGRLSGGFATEGQRSALVNREQAPILGNLAKQQTALSNENQNFSLASSLAGQLANSLRSDDESGYQRLLDQYNVATAQEQAAEAKRQWEAQQAEQRRQFGEQQRTAARTLSDKGYDLSSILNGLGANNSTPQNTISNKPSLDQIFGTQKNTPNAQKAFKAPTSGYSLLGSAYSPLLIPSLAAGTINANKDKINYALNNKNKIAKSLVSRIRGLF